MTPNKQNAPALTLLAALILVAAGCGGPAAAPKDPSDVPPPPKDAPRAEVKPKRVVSKEAKEAFAEALEAFKAASKSGLNASNCGEVASAFAGVYESHPKLVEAKFNEGVIWEECGDTNKAEQIYQEIARKHPGFGPAINNLGQIYFSRNNISSALQYFQKAAHLKNSEGYANLAVLQRNRALQGDGQALQEAVENIHRSLAVDSFNIEAYGSLALLLYDHAKNASQLEMARLICVQATKVNDKYAPIYNILGLILLRMGRVTPALKEFRKAVAINPDYLEAQMNIGAVTLSFRDYTSADEAFSKVLSLKDVERQTRVEALIGLGVAYRGQRKFQEAMAKYQEAQKLDPSNPAITYNMGILTQDYTFDASDPARAIGQLQTASTYLQQYVSTGKSREKVDDAKRRLKNINEMIPMLREQQKMMEEMKKAPPAPAAKEPAAPPAAAPDAPAGG